MSAILRRYGTVLRIYDNGGRTADRYTVVPPRWAREYVDSRGYWEMIGASEDPFHPQGFGQHSSGSPGAHLGRRVAWADIPARVQQFARQSFPEYAPSA